MWTGTFDFKWNGEKWIRDLNLNFNDTITREAAERAVNIIKADIDAKTSSGKYYYRYKNGQSWQGFSSRELSAPNNNFGELNDSISMRKIKNSKYLIICDSPYGAPLELGAPDNNLIKRPFFEHNIRKAFKNYIKDVETRYKAKLAGK